MRLTSEFAKVASANGGLSTSARLVAEISDQAASVYVMTHHCGMSLSHPHVRRDGFGFANLNI